MTSELTCYGYSPCVECAACRERDARIRELECIDAGRDLMDAEAEGVIDRLEAEVARLRAQLDAARETVGFAVQFARTGDGRLCEADLRAVINALGGDA